MRVIAKKGSSSAPDPVATAQAQGAANQAAVRESALVNQINQVSPFGTETYTGAIGSPGRTRTTALTPEGQQQLDLQNQIGTGLLGLGSNPLLSQVEGAVGTPLNFEGLQGISGAGDLEGQGAGLEQATFQRGQNLLQPDMDRQRDQLTTQLANQGIPEGSEAYNEAVGRMERGQQSQLENLALSSVGAGRAEQTRLAGLEQGIRQQQIQERLTERGQPINELAALLQGAPAIQGPQFQTPLQYNVGPAPYLSAQQLATGVGVSNAQNQGQIGAGLLGGVGSLFGGMLCSRDWKEDLGSAASYLDGIRKIAVNAWRYLPGSPGYDGGKVHVGPNAEQFRQLFQVGDGKTIHVIDAVGVLMQGMKELLARVEAVEASAHG